MFNSLVFVAAESLPQGLFRYFLSLWEMFRSSFFLLVQVFMEQTIVISGVEYTWINALIGGGVFMVLAWTIVKWLLP